MIIIFSNFILNFFIIHFYDFIEKKNDLPDFSDACNDMIFSSGHVTKKSCFTTEKNIIVGAQNR